MIDLHYYKEYLPNNIENGNLFVKYINNKLASDFGFRVANKIKELDEQTNT